MFPSTDAPLALLEPLRRQRAIERGASSVEMILVLPLFLGIVFAIIQGALFYDAGNVAQAAANAAAREARAYNSTEQAGSRAGYDFIDKQNSLRSADITVTRSATEVTVTITGQSLSLVPWLGTNITRSSSGPVERWVD